MTERGETRHVEVPPAPPQPPIAVRLTAAGTGAIAVVLVAGDITCLNTVLRLHRGPSPDSVQAGHFARVNVLAADGQVLDDALLVRTAVDRWELHVHGGMAVVEAVMATLAAAGARVVDLQEALRLGLLGDGLAGELLLALPGAVTETGLRILLAQGEALGAWVDHRQRALERGVELWQLHAACQWLLSRSSALSRLLAGNEARVAIVGPPNAGKSTLANALLGRPVSITSDLAGTTRDWVDAQAILVAGGGGDANGVQVPVIMVDTAGVRTTPDELELESIARTHRQAAEADVVVVLLDATRPVTEEERVLLRTYERALVAVNKMDVAGATMPAELAAAGGVEISAKTHAGLDTLMRRVLERLDLHAVGPGEPFAFSGRLRGLAAELAVCDSPKGCKALLTAMRDGTSR